jgi:uncharacterized membrane protein (UPF0136 family)
VLEKGINVLNLDESGFQKACPWSKGWVLKGSKVRSMKLRKFTNVTLTSVIGMKGEHYYSILKGSTN